MIHLWQSHEQAQHLRVVWSTKTSDWIPAGCARETLSSAARVASDGDVVEHFGVGILEDMLADVFKKRAELETYQNGVHEADDGFASSETLFVDTVQDGSEDWSRGGSSTLEDRLALVEDDNVVSDSSHIRISTTSPVEDSPSSTNVGVVSSGVRLIWRRVVSQEAVDSCLLISRLRIDVRESTTGWEAGDGDLSILGDVSALGEECGSCAGDERAGNWEIGREDLVSGTQAGRVVAASDTGVSGSDNDRNTLESELHPFIALALLVVGREVRLLLSVRDGDDVGGLVDTALELTLESSWVGIWVAGVKSWGVTSLTEGGIGAVGAVNAVKEVVEETGEVVVGLVEIIIGLEQNGVLRIDDGVGELEIQVRFSSSSGNGNWGSSTVNTVQDGLGALRNVGSEFSEEAVQVLLGVGVSLLKDTELVSGVGQLGIGDVVKSFDASRSDGGIAVLRCGAVGLLSEFGKSDTLWHRLGNGSRKLARLAEHALLELQGAALEWGRWCRLSAREQSDTGSDVVNMLLNVAWDGVFLAGNVLLSRIVLVDVVFGLEEGLNFGNRSIELNPLLVGGL